jgi:hypothetical protein
MDFFDFFIYGKAELRFPKKRNEGSQMLIEKAGLEFPNAYKEKRDLSSGEDLEYFI